MAEEGNDATDEEKHESNGFIGDYGLGILFHTCVGYFMVSELVFSPIMPVSNFFLCAMFECTVINFNVFNHQLVQCKAVF
jgi:hypothetical protein